MVLQHFSSLVTTQHVLFFSTTSGVSPSVYNSGEDERTGPPQEHDAIHYRQT